MDCLASAPRFCASDRMALTSAEIQNAGVAIRSTHDFMVLGRGYDYHPIGCITLIFKWKYHQVDDICMEYLSGHINWESARFYGPKD